ncbi:MAG: methyltransferase domain-containing protein [Planctomycetia bacterium]|nr:methyltransferase domain-containing protein [Planctomycetia bacterium]
MLQLSSLAMRGRRPTARVTPLLNLGCGRRRHPAWTNADLVPSAADVLAVDLRRPLPFAAASFTAVYASHVIEHLTPVDADHLLREAHRVLAPGGIVRIVVPDLEGIARAYLGSLEAAPDGGQEARWRHRWMIVELLDQLVRDRSGGSMRRWWSCDPIPCRDLIESRLGAEATAAMTALAAERARDGTPPAAPDSILMAEPVAAGEALRFAARGERHRWMYDRVSLADMLAAAGFAAPRRVGPTESAIPGFAGYELDADAHARPHKPDSLFMEAVRQ